ncbi:MAG: hypothetical protein GQ569_03075 [Methylococcaceae bacterium]|nr:hypothetical protein [Methylococcaceae bacterium]
MATELEYQAKIRSYDWEQLQDLWQAIKEKDTPEWANGKALEYLIIRAFELENAEVRYPYSVPLDTISTNEGKHDIEQIDGVVYTRNLSCLIECKDTQKAIDFEPISKLRSQLMRRPSTAIASIFSLSGFSYPALMLLNFIQPQTILAWEKDEIEYCLEHQNFCESLVKKYHQAVESGTYSFSIIDRGDLL